ncbi:MAG: LLM class F420-dependent oxidoreductase [Anaerolineales bacterium]|jgi:F420-dependent oxidoreductase-like protein
MRLGIHNPSWQYPGGPYESFEALKRKAQWAENHGFVWFSVMDHLIEIPNVGEPDQPFMESWTTLSALASVTQKIRLGVLVTSVAYRNPALLAKMASTVDIISRGRLTLGIGAGWFEKEYMQYGWEFPLRPATRIGQLEEAVRLIKAMWTQPRATFDGRYFHVREAILEPKPVQKPHPPVMIGGSGEQLTLRAVARQADACNLFGSPAEVRHKLEVLRQHCQAEGRRYDEIERTCLTGLVLGRDEQALKIKAEGLGVPAAAPELMTPSQAAQLLSEFAEAGIQLCILRDIHNDQETLELVAAEVMPRLARGH